MSQTNSTAVAEVIESINASLERAVAGLAHLKGMLVAEPEEQAFHPLDPANKKEDGKLTDRGTEICYRLFDAGKSKYAVGKEMDISYSAAAHRLEAWQKAGGINRIKQPIEPIEPI